ncbi:MAG: hypothetical protein BWK74_01955 [Desulfobacteraceae bacterium A6]|nr:MAG: hypothetical protein BWK74_01955 [Desulfobacteraceae bacterium A6]
MLGAAVTLMASPETADIFGWLKHQLKRAGTPIPINNVWIAAHAIGTGSTLITFDSHFDRILALPGFFCFFCIARNIYRVPDYTISVIQSLDRKSERTYFKAHNDHNDHKYQRRTL